MFDNFMQRYSDALDTTMRETVDLLPAETPGFEVMSRYPLGWVNQDNQPHERQTGKRIRPMFLLLCTEAAGGDWQQALPAASAVELIHNFSLIHDDIQDDSPIRHGRPTVWKVWGVPNAINAGDVLFSLAYASLSNLSERGVPAEIILQAWKILNHTNIELTRGQHLDMYFEKQDHVTIEEYVSMISGKSAALLSACAEIGALIATQDKNLAQRYADFALNLGIAFQIRDDILGIWGNPDVTGKSTATDIVSRKKSLPVLYGLTQSDRLATIYQKPELTDADVAEAVTILDSLDAQGYTRSMETTYYESALTALDGANPQGQAAKWLHQFVNALFERNY